MTKERPGLPATVSPSPQAEGRLGLLMPGRPLRTPQERPSHSQRDVTWHKSTEEGTNIMDVIEEYLLAGRANGWSKSTVGQYRWQLNRWWSWCNAAGVTNLDQLTAKHLRTWAASIRDTWSAATCRIAVVSLKGFLRWAADEENIPRSLVAVLKTPKRTKRAQRVATSQEIDLLLATCPESPAGIRNLAIISLSFDSLLRVTEVCRLHVRDLNLISQAITVWGKGNKVEVVRFGDQTATYLTNWLQIHPDTTISNYLFISVGGLTPGAPMTAGGVRLMMKKLAARAGIPHLSPHSLRRGGAVAMIEAGAPSRLVQFHGRWDTLEMLELYTQQVNASKVFGKYSPIDQMHKPDA